MNSAKNQWEIGLSSWIIQDGNYDDFEEGERAEFALEHYSEAYRKVETSTKFSKSLGAAKYEIIGQVVYLAAEAWVLDFGICAFHRAKPPAGIVTGDFVAGEIYLGIDPFFYFERLNAFPKMPPLIYTWQVIAIGLQTTPLIEARDPAGKKILVRDNTKLGYQSIAKTDVWKDDGGNGEYILTCDRLDIPPKTEIGGES